MGTVRGSPAGKRARVGCGGWSAAGAQSPGESEAAGSRPGGQSIRVSRGGGIRRGRGFIHRPVTREGGTCGGRGEGREAEEGGERDGPRRATGSAAGRTMCAERYTGADGRLAAGARRSPHQSAASPSGAARPAKARWGREARKLRCALPAEPWGCCTRHCVGAPEPSTCGTAGAGHLCSPAAPLRGPRAGEERYCGAVWEGSARNSETHAASCLEFSTPAARFPARWKRSRRRGSPAHPAARPSLPFPSPHPALGPRARTHWVGAGRERGCFSRALSAAARGGGARRSRKSAR